MFIAYLIIGAFAGLMAGLLGIGGGIIVVPALASAFFYVDVIPPHYIMQLSIGTSLAAMIVTLLSASYVHAKQSCVRWDMVRLLLPGLLLGSILGAVVARYLPSFVLRIFFGAFLMVMAYRIFFVQAGESARPMPSPWLMNGAAGLIGLLSSILGAGGGLMLVPFMMHCRVNLREAAGTSLVCGIGIGSVATLSFMWLGASTVNLPWSTGYIYWPAFVGVAIASMLFAPLGAMLSHQLPVAVLRRVLAVCLIFVGIDMLFFGAG